MGILAVLLQEENLFFSKEHLRDIKQKSSRMGHRGKRDFYYDQQIALSCHSHDDHFTQPYRFCANRFVLLFDGILTNLPILHKHLRSKGVQPKSDHPIEIVAQLYLLEKTKSFSMLEGAFVLLLWDQKDKVLVGARDPFGLKRLYYTETAEETIFSTEKKSALFSYHEERLDDFALHHYLDYEYIPEPHTMTKGIKQIKKGHYFVKKLQEPVQFIRYFTLNIHPVQKHNKKVHHKGRKALQQVFSSMFACRNSNGIYFTDNLSSFVLANLAKVHDQDLKLYYITSEKVPSLGEIAAEELQLEKKSIHITPEQFMTELPRIIWFLDDPFADPKVIEDYFLTKTASQETKKLFSAIGAEAILGKEIKKHRGLSLARSILPGLFNQNSTKRNPTPLLSKAFKQRLLTRIVTVDSDEQQYRNEIHQESPMIKFQYGRLQSRLPSDQLRRLEKLTAVHQLTLHTPFLNKTVYETFRSLSLEQRRNRDFVLSLLGKKFSEYKIRRFIRLESRALKIPLIQWLREDCFEWVEHLILISDIDYLMSKQEVLRLLSNFREKPQENFQPLWSIFMFILWHLVYVEDYYCFRKDDHDLIG